MEDIKFEKYFQINKSIENKIYKTKILYKISKI